MNCNLSKRKDYKSKQSSFIGIAIALILLCTTLMVVQSSFANTKRGFLVGISKYENANNASWHNINGANDVALLAKTLKSQSFEVKSITNNDATANNIRKGLKSLQRKCRAGDIVYIHFSCHGQPFEDFNGDENDGWDEALIPVDAPKNYKKGAYEGKNHITDDELNLYFNSIRKTVGPKGFVCVVIDACHAGSSYRSEDEDSVIIRGTDTPFTINNKHYAPRIDKRGKIKIEKAADMANICVLEACRSYQVNSEIKVNGNYYGSLSYYVNKVMESMANITEPKWSESVRSLMNKDRRLVRQNIVIESTF